MCIQLHDYLLYKYIIQKGFFISKLKSLCKCKPTPITERNVLDDDLDEDIDEV